MLLYLLAESQRALKDLTAARATAEKLVAAHPDDVRGLHVMSLIMQDQGDIKGAERALRDLIARDPIDANALNSLGYLLAERGDRLDEAITLVERALKIEPGNPSYLDSLGWAYLQQGKLDRADPHLTEAAAKLKGSSVVQDHLGDLRFKQQRYRDAAAAWVQALAGDGQSIDRTKIEQKIGRPRAHVSRRIAPSISRSAARRYRLRPRLARLPSDPGVPFLSTRPRSGDQPCRDLKTMRAVLGVSGRAGRRLRASIDAGFEAPARVRLELPAPGKPIFIFVANGESGTLLLPREDRVLRDAPPADTLEALAGVRLGPEDLRRIVAGCGMLGRPPAGGRAFGEEWRAIDANGATDWLQRVDGAWRLVAATDKVLESALHRFRRRPAADDSTPRGPRGRRLDRSHHSAVAGRRERADRRQGLRDRHSGRCVADDPRRVAAVGAVGEDGVTMPHRHVSAAR